MNREILAENISVRLPLDIAFCLYTNTERYQHAPPKIQEIDIESAKRAGLHRPVTIRGNILGPAEGISELSVGHYENIDLETLKGVLSAGDYTFQCVGGIYDSGLALYWGRDGNGYSFNYNDLLEAIKEGINIEEG